MALRERLQNLNVCDRHRSIDKSWLFVDVVVANQCDALGSLRSHVHERETKLLSRVAILNGLCLSGSQSEPSLR